MKKFVYILSFLLLLSAYGCSDDDNGKGKDETENPIPDPEPYPKPDIKIIVHRGYHIELSDDNETVTDITTENSLASLKGALALDVYGTEFDIMLTSDGLLVAHHDETINGTNIQRNPYSSIKDIRLGNGEVLPIFSDFLKEGVKQNKVKLIVEIKNHYSADRDVEAAIAAFDEVKSHNAQSIVEWISFSKEACDKIINLDPSARVSLLSYEGIGRPVLTPRELKDQGYYGLDYNSTLINNNKEWVKQAKELGVAVNVWTINWKSLMLDMIALDVDYITTDYPGYLIKLLDE